MIVNVKYFPFVIYIYPGEKILFVRERKRNYETF